jgi:type IV pilus assembly protein PilM
MNPILPKSASHASARPPAAIELSPEGVLAAAVPSPGQPPVYAFEPLPPGTILPGIAEANLPAPEVVAAAIRSALAQVSPRSRSITLVLPDSVVRVFVLDYDSFPTRPDEAYPVLRVRLRRMVPFDVEHAGLSYQVLASNAGPASSASNSQEVRVLAAILPGPVLAEYESAVRAAGYEPGAVLPSTLAAQELADIFQASLVANLSQASLTTSIANGQDLLLYRTLDLPAEPEQRRDEVQRGIAVAAAYFEDKLGYAPTRLYYSAGREADAFPLWVSEPGISLVNLSSTPSTGAATSLGHTSLAGVAGALAGVR